MIRFFLYLLITLSPLPFASARPLWQWLWVAVVGLMAAVYFLRSVRTPRPSWPKPLTFPVGLVFLFIVWGFAQATLPISDAQQIDVGVVDALLVPTALISVSPQATLANASFFLSHLIFFVIVFVYCSNPERAVRLLRFCGIIVAIYCTYGFIVFAAGNTTVLWYEKTSSLNTLTSTFINRNTFAAYAGLGLQCLVAYAYSRLHLQLAEGQAFFRHISQTNLATITWLLIAIILITTSIILTNSRAGFVSIFSATLLLVILSQQKRLSARFGLSSIIGSLVIIVVAASIYDLSGDTLNQRLQADFNQDGRFKIYALVQEAIADRPVTGFGLGTFSDVFREYRDQSVAAFYERAHNDYLEIVLTAGIPASIILFTAFISLLVILAGRLQYGNQYRSFIALGLTVTVQLCQHSLLDFPLQMPANSYLWCAILAASLALADHGKRNFRRDHPL